MEEKNGRKWPFKIQFITLAMLPLILAAVNIPESFKASYPILEKVFNLGAVGVGAIFLFAFPIGMIGFLNARKEKVHPKLNTATKMLGVTNCVIGAMFVGIVLMILFFTFVEGV